MFLQLSQIVNARVHNLLVGDIGFILLIYIIMQMQKYVFFLN